MSRTPAVPTRAAGRRRSVAVPVVATLLAAVLTACGDAGDRSADTVVPTRPSLSTSPDTASTATATTASPAVSGSPSASPKASAGSSSPSARASGPTATRGAGGASGGRGSGGSSGGGSGDRATPGTKAPGAPAAPRPPTSAALSSALLTTGQLPSGYVKTVLQNDPPTRSDRPDCLDALNSLESYRSTRAGAVEARVTFAQSQSGPFLQEVVRWLPGAGARQDLRQAAAVLSGCAEFAIGWSDGMTGTERVVAHGSAGIGDASWHATVTATTGTFTVQETLVLAVVGKTLVVLSEAGSPTGPSRSRTVTLARTATARVHRMPADNTVLLLPAAANRGPEVFTDPDRYDITRTGGPDRLSFAAGLHHCLGAPPARLEAETALQRSGESRALSYVRGVWSSASEAVGTTRALGSRHDAYEVLAAQRDRIETTAWRGERGRTACGYCGRV
ncbi:hypothetical protein [Streptomyces sp. NPDC050263]|uniref:hypothetical protein n=1 Tax=Streptomyces sp. NPDC050263 TaxID=3155037 RepID=UPI003435B17A